MPDERPIYTKAPQYAVDIVEKYLPRLQQIMAEAMHEAGQAAKALNAAPAESENDIFSIRQNLACSILEDLAKDIAEAKGCPELVAVVAVSANTDKLLRGRAYMRMNEHA